MVVIDSHTHIWGRSTNEHPWKDINRIDKVVEFPIGETYTAEDLLMDMENVGIDRAVVVNYPIYGKNDNWYTLKNVEQYPELYGIVNLDPAIPDATTRLDDYLETDDIVGFRLSVGNGEPSWLNKVLENTQFWKKASQVDALTEIITDPEYLDNIVKLVNKYPEITYVVDHFGLIDPGIQTESKYYKNFDVLANNPNVHVKASAAPVLSKTDFPYEDIHPILNWFMEKFGRERLFWGSDYPYVSIETKQYEKNYHWLREVDTLSTKDKKWLTGRSLNRLLSQ